jgi:hypothetical protein
VGSSPTPGVLLRGLYNNFINISEDIVIVYKKEMTVQTSQTEANQMNGYYNLEKKIDIITKSLSRGYYKNFLIKLAERNLENANIICDYIIAEQT